MTGRIWYVDDARSPVIWASAVVNSLATITIHKIQEVPDIGSSANFSSIFARPSWTVSTTVQQHAVNETSTDPVPPEGDPNYKSIPAEPFAAGGSAAAAQENAAADATSKVNVETVRARTAEASVFAFAATFGE